MRVLSGLQDNRDTLEAWHFIYEDKPHGYGRFELYDTRTRRLIGSLGTTGFRPGPLDRSEMFVIDGMSMANGFGSAMLTWNSFENERRDYDEPHLLIEGQYPISRNQLILPAEESLYLIDLKQRSVNRLLSDETIQSIAIANRLETLPDDFQPRGPEEADDTQVLRQFVAVRTPETVVLLNPNDGTQSDLTIPEELRSEILTVYLTRDGGAVINTYVQDSAEPITPSTFASDWVITWVGPDGNITKSETVTLHHSTRMVNLDAMLPLMLPGPLLSAGSGAVLLATLNLFAKREPFLVTARDYLERTWPMQLLVILLAAGLAYAADRHRANRRLPRSYAWLAFVFLFGLSGFAGYLLHRRWPVRHPVPPPQPTGAEVFA